MVRALYLYSGGPEFKSCSLPTHGFVFVIPDSTPPCFVNSQLVSVPPVEIFGKFLFLINFVCVFQYPWLEQ